MTAKLGASFTALSYSTSEQPFLNIMKMAQSFQAPGVATGGTGVGTITFDTSGYPTSLNGSTSGTYANITIVMAYALPPSPNTGLRYGAGNYVLLYDTVGSPGGTIALGGDAVFVSQTTGRQLYNVAAAGQAFLALTIAGSIDPSNYFRNIRIVFSPDSTGGSGAGTVVGVNGLGTNEAALNAGAIMNPLWLARFQTFQSFRFMDWFNTNGYGSITRPATVTWANRPLPTDATWTGPLGVPMETMVTVCNLCNADAHLNMPQEADDTYNINFATYVRDNLKKTLNCAVEYGNEWWNTYLSTSSYVISKAPGQFPGAAADFEGGQNYYLFRLAAISTIWRGIWTGADAARLKMVFSAWTSNYPTLNQFFGPQTFWNDTIPSHIDAICVTWYFFPPFAYAWANLPLEMQLNNIFTEMNSGGIVPTGASAPTAIGSGTPTAYTLTSGLSIPATPVDGQFISFVPNVDSNNNTTPCTISVDGGPAKHLYDPTGSYIFGQQNGFRFFSIGTYIFYYMSDLDAWVQVTGGAGYTGGSIKQTKDIILENKTRAAAFGVNIVMGYEGGGGIQDYFLVQKTIDMFNRAANDSRMMGAYKSMLDDWNSLGLGTLHQFTNASSHLGLGGTTFGSLSTIQDAHAAQYDACMQYINPNRRGMNVKGGF